MISYRDKAFCNQSSACANEDCPHHFGDDDRKAAVRWWGSEDAPVAYMNRRDDECGYRPRQGAT